jgi:squalene synthase HpnD
MSDSLTKAIELRVRQAGTSFYWGMRLLTPERRAAMFAIYVFCREVDDIVDGDLRIAEKHRQLDGWRLEINAIYRGDPATDIGHALLSPVRRFGLQQDDFMAVIDGMQMDADGPIRAPDGNVFDLYIDRVACAVGRLSVRAFGADEAGLPVAAALGRGLQITNILRDLDEDAMIGRLYLPRELLTAHGIETTEPMEVLAHPRLSEVCSVLADDARQCFAEARRAVQDCPRGTMRGSNVMQAAYEAVLDRLIARGWKIRLPVKVPTLVKFWLVVRHGLFGDR